MLTLGIMEARASSSRSAAPWLWLLWLAAVWVLLLTQVVAEARPWGVLLCTVYMAGHFAATLVPGTRWHLLGSIASLLAANVAMIGLAPLAWSGLVALSCGLLALFSVAEPLVRVRAGWVRPFAEAGGALTLLTVALTMLPEGALPFMYALLVGAAAAAAVLGWRRAEGERREAAASFDALANEFRKLKRRFRDSEDAARAEERLGIARRLHDSVGHRLTTLLVQLEAARLQAGDSPEARRMSDLKRLAQRGLDETRRAVSALSEQDVGSMPSLIRLIRNLEAESSLQVDFTVRHGALSVQLEREPAVALYRAVQEALTNAMRHGAARRVEVRFEAPGGSIFRFEVSNQVEREPGVVNPGFGLKTMRERVEAAGGSLEVAAQPGRFVVRGSFPLKR